MWVSAEVGLRDAASDVGMLGEESVGGSAEVSAFAFISRCDAARLSMAMALVRATDPCLLRAGAAAPCAMLEDPAGKTSIEADSGGGDSAEAWHGRRWLWLYGGMQEDAGSPLGICFGCRRTRGREGQEQASFGAAVGVRHGRACAAAEPLAGCTPLVPCSCCCRARKDSRKGAMRFVTFFLKKKNLGCAVALSAWIRPEASLSLIHFRCILRQTGIHCITVRAQQSPATIAASSSHKLVCLDSEAREKFFRVDFSSPFFFWHSFPTRRVLSSCARNQPSAKALNLSETNTTISLAQPSHSAQISNQVTLKKKQFKSARLPQRFTQRQCVRSR